MKRLIAIGLSSLILWSCKPSSSFETPGTIHPRTQISPAKDDQIQLLMRSYNSPSLALGIIQKGELVTTRYYGEQAPGIPLGPNSMFNTASVQKAVTSETIIRLVDKGLLTLDEPLSPHYIHPDIEADDRHNLLTPRIVLTHKTGFLNWPHSYPDDKLAFTVDPGKKYGYSGIGFMIMARAVEAKLGKSWPQIVREEIYDPLGMDKASTIQENWMDEYYVVPVDEDGNFRSDFELDYGYWNPADDLYVTVEEYAKFLIGVYRSENVTDDLKTQRKTVHSDLTDNEIWGCDGVVDPCPKPFGHGLGWFVFGYDGITNLQHGGNDRSEAAIGYIELETGNGAIVFVNSTQGVLMWPKVIEVIDPDQKFVGVFNHVIDKFLTPKSE